MYGLWNFSSRQLWCDGELDALSSCDGELDSLSSQIPTREEAGCMENVAGDGW